MYAIDEGLQKINGEMVETFHREVIDGNTNLEVEAGTNGYHGGDTGHGSRTYLRIKDQGCTDIHCTVKRNSYDDRANEIEISLGGDTELETMKEALRWMLSILEAQSDMEE